MDCRSGLSSSWGAICILRLRVTLDGKTLTTLSGSLRYKNFALDTLSGMTIGGWSGDLLLPFDDGSKARVSNALDGFGDVIRYFEGVLAQRRKQSPKAVAGKTHAQRPRFDALFDTCPVDNFR